MPADTVTRTDVPATVEIPGVAPTIEERLSISMLDRWGLRLPTEEELQEAWVVLTHVMGPFEQLKMSLANARREVLEEGRSIPLGLREFGAIVLTARILERNAADLVKWLAEIVSHAEDLALETPGKVTGGVR